MKFTLFFQALMLPTFLWGQIFTEVLPNDAIQGVWESSVAFADVDGDGDEDMLITGRNNAREPVTELHINVHDEGRSFQKMIASPFEDVRESALAFADVDGDGDQDVLITGLNASFDLIAKLYLNDGAGNFSEVPDTTFEGVWEGSIAFADVDGDQDQDVLITGRDSELIPISHLYLNDGDGNFTQRMSAPFEAVYQSSANFEDVDGDSDQDVLIVGEDAFGKRIAKLYINDGGGFFSLKMNTPFEGAWETSTAFSDIDEDGDQDLLITGQNSSFLPFSKLYLNDGAGNFTETEEPIFENVWESSVGFSDIDGDGDEDVLITGRNILTEPTTDLYYNDGMGIFTKIEITLLEDVLEGSLDFSDIDGDGDQDVLITGQNISGENISRVYVNGGLGNFRKMRVNPFIGLSLDAVDFADTDLDGDLDILITGQGNYLNPFISRLYTNDGTGTFCEEINTPFESVRQSAVAFADIDGDDDQDVLITGENDSLMPISALYINDGLGIFSQVENTPFEGVQRGSIAFADVDGDNDQDVLITGIIPEIPQSEYVAKLYINDGMGVFTEKQDSPFKGVYQSSIAFSDIDGDGDQDVLITGWNSFDRAISKLYTNDGTGTFREVMNTPFENVWRGSIAFADIDGDLDQDVLITGLNASNEPVSRLYRNEGMTIFSEIIDMPFEDVWRSTVTFSDIDRDGDQDVLIMGEKKTEESMTKLYVNNGTGVFSEMMTSQLLQSRDGPAAFADIDKDGDDDLLIGGDITKLYINDGVVSTTKYFSSITPFDFSIYPNPTKKKKLNLSFESARSGIINLNIFNLSGQMLSQHKKLAISGTQVFSIDISDLTQGIYLIQVDAEKKKGIAKFVVQ